VLNYIQETIDDKRIICATSLDEIFMWVDASHATHPDMKGKPGGILTMGWGALHCKSSKQKLNTRSTMESELVDVSEYLPYDIWFIHFLAHQGYMIKSNKLFQDNESAIKLESNWRNACSSSSRHIDIRHFWVKDRTENKELKVSFCLTELMLADYFTKPLQGKSFHEFRN